LEIASTAEEVRRIVSAGRHAMLLGLEGGHAIEDSLENLRQFYRRGIRYMTLTWSFSHSWADSSGDPLHEAETLHRGLTDFGREVVREMNDLGMLVDISHVSDETFWDALEISRAPVIASHSSVRAIASHPRNLSDDMLRAVATNGGVVMINFSALYLDPRKTTLWRLAWDWVAHLGGAETSVSDVADHIDHVVRVAGVDHVGLGSDFDGAPFLPAGLGHVGELPNLTLALLRRGYSEDDVRKILGENLLQVLAQAEHLSVRSHAAQQGSFRPTARSNCGCLVAFWREPRVLSRPRRRCRPQLSTDLLDRRRRVLPRVEGAGCSTRSNGTLRRRVSASLRRPTWSEERIDRRR
jgi:membrane dipeptidase